jgi:predicted DNA-binding transcriptional regulator YafY
MPKNDKHSTLSRQWQLLKMIPLRPPGLTTRELRDRLEREDFPVTLRTVERDLDELTALFDLTTAQDGATRAKRWYAVKGKLLEIDSIDLIDAVSLALAGDMLEKSLPGVLLQPVANRIQLARSKLKSLGRSRMAKWSEKVRYVHGSLELQPPKINSRVMVAIQNALIDGKQVEVGYDAFSEKTKHLRLHPLSLVLRGSVPYVVATTFDYQDLRLYAVHRMRTVTALEDAISIPADYSVDDYLRSGALDFASGSELKLEARLSDELAMYLTETPLAADQEVKFRNGHYVLTATVHDSWQLHFWLMSQGAGITVLKPARLRAAIADAHRAAVHQYGTDGT